MKETREGLRQRSTKSTKDFGPISNFSVFTGKQNDYKTFPSSVGYVVIIAGIALLKIAYVINSTLPHQVAIQEEQDQPERFIGERAEFQLKRLTDIGTRVVGSYENEILAVDFLKREISFIIQQAEPVHNILVDVQKPTGSYYLDFKPYGFRNYYANIQNIVVRLSPKTPSNHSVLINCHYDTVPESPGASDNGLNCVVMLEVLRKLSNLKKALPNNIIFLFNGAEENPLQAAHGFITQHKWSKEVRVVVNLDSAGAGGKDILFQTSSTYPWLVEAYARSVPHPSGGVHGEELFQSGIIPSDTDFRVFRDFGPVPGLDLAHSDNGYIYHTKLDRMEYISRGVYQHTGDNILALVKELVSSPDLAAMVGDYEQKSLSRMVYFDVFGLLMVVYTEGWAIFLNLATAVISFCSILKTFSLLPATKRSPVKSIIISAGLQLFGWLLSTAMVVMVSKTLDLFNATMSWYSNMHYVIPLYAFPLLFTSAVCPVLIRLLVRSGESPREKAIEYMNGSQFLWTIALLLGTAARIRTSFIFMLLVLFPSIGSIVATYSTSGFNVRKYLLTYLVSVLFPIFYLLSQAVRTFPVLVPMAGRMGPQTNSELVIAVLTIVFGIPSTSYIIPLVVMLRKPKTLLTVLCAIHILSMVLVIGTPLGFPYSGDVENPALQRFYILHGERTFHDEKGKVRKTDSGFFVQGLDRNNVNYVSQLVPQLQTARSAAPDCLNELFCGVPVFTSRFIGPAPFSYWVPAKPPLIHHPTTLDVVSQTQIAVRARRVRLSVTGPDHISVLMAPREGVRLLKWSFDEFEPKQGPVWKDRPTYMVYYSHGLVGGTLEFDIDLEVKNGSSPVIDVAVVGHYMHDRSFRTEEFKNFLSEFPDWAHLTPWTTTYKTWVV